MVIVFAVLSGGIKKLGFRNVELSNLIGVSLAYVNLSVFLFFLVFLLLSNMDPSMPHDFSNIVGLWGSFRLVPM